MCYRYPRLFVFSSIWYSDELERMKFNIPGRVSYLSPSMFVVDVLHSNERSPFLSLSVHSPVFSPSNNPSSFLQRLIRIITKPNDSFFLLTQQQISGRGVIKKKYQKYKRISFINRRFLEKKNKNNRVRGKKRESSCLASLPVSPYRAHSVRKVVLHNLYIS